MVKKNTRSKIIKMKHKKTKIKKNNRKLRGGVDTDSPRTKSVKKIQATARGRSTRQTKKVTTFNKLLESGATKYKKAIPTLDLKGVNLKGAILSKRVLNGIDLQKVDLTGAVLNGTKLVEANLSGSILKNTTIKKSDLTNSICKKCNFKGAILNSSDFTNANLEDSIFETGQMLGTNFENANLKGCIFRSINLGYDGKPRQATNFKGANLDNCKIDNLHIFDNKYLNNNEVVTIKNIEVDLEKYGSLSSTISKITFEDSKFKNLKFMSQRALSRHQIDSVIFSRCEFINYSGHSSNYIHSTF